MAFPTASSERQRSHHRRIDVRAHSRGAGRWEAAATVRDVRAQDAATVTHVVPAGQPIDDTLLLLFAAEQFDVIESGARTHAPPCPVACQNQGDAHEPLVGLKLMPVFRRAVCERLSGVKGCTPISEISHVLPTAVMQSFAAQVVDARGRDADGTRPMAPSRWHPADADRWLPRLAQRRLGRRDPLPPLAP